MAKEEFKPKPIRQGLEFQKKGTPRAEREKEALARRAEIHKMLTDDPPRAYIDVLERDPKTNEITKYLVRSKGDDSVLAYENDRAFIQYVKRQESVSEQARERTKKGKNLPAEIHPENPHSLRGKLPGEEEGRGN